VHLALFLQAVLPLAQPARARLRNRPRFRRAPLVQAALGIARPAAPALRRRQLRRQLVTAPLAKTLVLGAVDRVRLGQDLLGDLVVVEVLVLRGVRVHLRAVHRQHRHADQAGVRAQRQHLTEQARQRRLVTLAKARDRAVIRPLVRGDHPEREIVHARPLDHPRRTPPHGVRVKQQRHHHRRIVRRTAMPVPTVSPVERRQIHLRHGVDHKPRKVPLGQPLAQTRRQQQLLLTITHKEVLGHNPIVLTARTTPPVCATATMQSGGQGAGNISALAAVACELRQAPIRTGTTKWGLASPPPEA
jgi:hypothetical protein